VTVFDQRQLAAVLGKHGCAEHRWLAGADLVVSPWVRFKCMYGCGSFGKKGTCPPEAPPLEECRAFFSAYEHVAVLRFEKRVDAPEERKPWARDLNLRLLQLEREVFLAGYHKAFLLFMDECCICADCAGTRVGCLNPKKARPSPEALGMDVFATVTKCGFPIAVLTDPAQAMNRYAFLLVG
jgi:predicted metal-binding protein